MIKLSLNLFVLQTGAAKARVNLEYDSAENALAEVD